MNTQFISTLLLKSGEILMDGFGVVTQYDNKHDQSNIVTESDFKSEELIRKIISSEYPNHNILGEEHGFEDKQSDYTWIIDPLDGTSNYAARIPWFGILVALVKECRPILAGAYLPVTDEMYLAQAGKGATKNGKKIDVTDEVELKNLLCCYSLDYSEDSSKTEREVWIMKSLVHNCRNLRSTNSIVDFCLVADGRMGAALNQTMKIWDIAAPHLIIEEAGGVVTDIDGQKIKYIPSKASLNQNFTAITANAKVHDKILQLI